RCGLSTSVGFGFVVARTPTRKEGQDQGHREQEVALHGEEDRKGLEGRLICSKHTVRLTSPSPSNGGHTLYATHIQPAARMSRSSSCTPTNRRQHANQLSSAMQSRALNEPPEVRAGLVLGRYELLVPIAAGGMAQVWAARRQGAR